MKTTKATEGYEPNPPASKKALITGAAGGIGREIALLLAKKGYACLLTGRREEPLTKLAAELQAFAPCQLLTADLATPEGAATIAAWALEGGAPDVLINNAGFGAYGPFTEMPLGLAEEMITCNVTAPTTLCRLLLPAMRQNKKGYILNVASTAALCPGPYMAVYYAAKAYLLSFSRALHQECRGTGVTVTALCPGPTETGFFARAGTRQGKLYGLVKRQAPGQVAQTGIKALFKGKPAVISGGRNRLLLFASRLLPASTLAALVGSGSRPKT